MRRLMILAALAGCTAANEDGPDVRCAYIEASVIPFGGKLSRVDADGYPVAYADDDDGELFLWPGTRYPATFRRIKSGHSVEEWGCYVGGQLAYECVEDDCTCYESGQSWECIGPPGPLYIAVKDAQAAHGPYTRVTQ